MMMPIMFITMMMMMIRTMLMMRLTPPDKVLEYELEDGVVCPRHPLQKLLHLIIIMMIMMMIMMMMMIMIMVMMIMMIMILVIAHLQKPHSSVRHHGHLKDEKIEGRLKIET